MQFVIRAFDGKDEEAFNRRLAARPEHLALGSKMKAEGRLLFAAAILDDDGDKLIGSVMICEFESRSGLDSWLREEPYVTGQVWNEIEVLPCRVAPSFQKGS